MEMLEALSVNPIITVIITAITVLGSSSAWRFYEKHLEAKNDQKRREQLSLEKERAELKDDLRERVAVLEVKLEKAELRNVELQQEMLKLVEKIAILRTEVEFLRKENAILRAREQRQLNVGLSPFSSGSIP